MKRLVKKTPYTIEPDGQNKSGPCPCCGNYTRTIWGYIHGHDRTLAVYFVRWTPGRIDHGATVELIIGAWGDESTPADRRAVLLRYGVTAKGAGFMVIDAEPRVDDALVGKAMKRQEVVGTPLATQAFALADEVWLHEKRISEIKMWPQRLN